ncbi:hypothetical protein [Paracraurococcus ruber]|uniref:Uncharacterized protein n=1 Tax=Paracraurococcus ruber TaxID=77675 RepID=A0ABS1D5X1_9PROT|nr:hypothetical protein [Paracraurococcus ruber]MBK1662214.1 hypothetical protein [Paracraurococcus ruber]TDG14305.1 hypothetical protein E2C05_30055 [Paracraurococcus ruber]
MSQTVPKPLGAPGGQIKWNKASPKEPSTVTVVNRAVDGLKVRFYPTQAAMRAEVNRLHGQTLNRNQTASYTNAAPGGTIFVLAKCDGYGVVMFGVPLVRAMMNHMVYLHPGTNRLLWAQLKDSRGT